SYVPPDPTRSTHQRSVPYPELPVEQDDQEERWTGQSDAVPQLPNALAHASPEVKAALASVNDNTRAMAAAVYHKNGDQNLAIKASSSANPHSSLTRGQPTPRSASDNLVLPSNPTVRTRSSGCDVASRCLRDLTSSPHYEGEHWKAATRRWLRQCSEYFCLEALLTNINTTDKQRVVLAITWLKETTLHAWWSLLDAHDANPSIAVLQMWEKFKKGYSTAHDPPSRFP
ncbi:hypothetical protein KEM55_000294, partial [Ascosphaera atra]